MRSHVIAGSRRFAGRVEPEPVKVEASMVITLVRDGDELKVDVQDYDSLEPEVVAHYLRLAADQIEGPEDRSRGLF